jgi:S-adenosylmethionine:tRNA ribosyltransferase-isomerase
MWEDGYAFTVMSRNDKEAILKPMFDLSSMASLLERFGTTPLPPYMKDSPLSEEQRRSEYQTVFAKEDGSVAAPTAGLHFSEKLIKKIIQHGCSVEYVTLHVNLGTFAPLTEDQWEKKQLHTEYYSIAEDVADRLNTAKAEGRPIVAVGTTSVRTLESACLNKKIAHLNGQTNLFLTEESTLHFVDHLITNFHVPKSSLLMLVSALTGREKVLELYNIAITERCRLFSFGDGMMIL